MKGGKKKAWQGNASSIGKTTRSVGDLKRKNNHAARKAEGTETFLGGGEKEGSEKEGDAT